MSDSATPILQASVSTLPGVGPKRERILERLGIQTIGDALHHFPMRYEREQEIGSIRTAVESLGTRERTDDFLVVEGEIASLRTRPGRRPRLEVILEDDSGTLQLTWFSAPWLRDRLTPGMRIRCRGKLQRYGPSVQMINPKWKDITANDGQDASASAAADVTLRPVYPATEELSSQILAPMIAHALDRVLDTPKDSIELVDHLPGDYRKERGLPDYRNALIGMHRPAHADDAAAARRRFAFDELLLMQLAVMAARDYRRRRHHAYSLRHDDVLDDRIRSRLPFDLTDGQNTAVSDIVLDLTGDIPMNRLLQGDVGSGKTAVAVYAMLMAVASGHQAAFVAPTELLAEQQVHAIQRLLGESDVRAVLMTGSQSAADRRELERDLASGTIGIIIGTHALLADTVRFKSLGLVIIDEQHRFGVQQRAALRSRGNDDQMPHVLVMTATPIPRTLALTLFGDLDVSTIDTLPPGRTPVITRHVLPRAVGDVWAYARSRAEAGERIFIVVPAIDEAGPDMTSLTTLHRQLSAGPFRGLAIGVVHGRLNTAERDSAMSDFRDGNTPILIATTVIEVGVDVPDATMMVVMDADRFGLAQLHQLRGRVGRGDKQSLCVLVADPATDEGIARLAAMVETTDGFEIAERDLMIRGPGEIFGMRQSGVPPFRAAQLPDDLELLRLARRDAEAWIARSPSLGSPEEAALRARINERYRGIFTLGDVG